MRFFPDEDDNFIGFVWWLTPISIIIFGCMGMLDLNWVNQPVEFRMREVYFSFLLAPWLLALRLAWLNLPVREAFDMRRKRA